MAGIIKAVVCDILSGMVHIKEHMLQIAKNNQCSGGSRFLLSLSESSFTVCPITYNHKYNVLSAFPSFLNHTSIYTQKLCTTTDPPRG